VRECAGKICEAKLKNLRGFISALWKIARSRPRDAKRGFKIAGKLRDGFNNLVGLFHQLILQPRGGFRFEAHDFGGGDYQGEIVVHFMAQVGEFFVQLGDLRGGKCDGCAWQRHREIIAQSGLKSSALSRWKFLKIGAMACFTLSDGRRTAQHWHVREERSMMHRQPGQIQNRVNKWGEHPMGFQSRNTYAGAAFNR
jgi:hypothetical protein